MSGLVVGVEFHGDGTATYAVRVPHNPAPADLHAAVNYPEGIFIAIEGAAVMLTNDDAALLAAALIDSLTKKDLP